MFMQKSTDGGGVRKLAFDEFGLGGEHGAMAMAEIVVDDDLMSLIEQDLSNGSTDVAGAAGYENSQWGFSF
jgi:hypothetical protein